MAEALVAIVLDRLASIMKQEIRQEVRQVLAVRKEVKKLTSALRAIRAALVDAEKRQVTEEVVKDWLEKLKDISYDADDVLDEWSTAILKLQIEGVDENAPNIPMKKKVCSNIIPSPCFCFGRVILHHEIAVKIKELNERLDAIAQEKDRYNFKSISHTEEPERQKTTSFVDVLEVYGRDQDKETIVSNFLCDSCSQQERGFHIISIVGMGGIGKTTLAQLVYNDKDVKAHFEKRIWVCVSDPFDEMRIAKVISNALDGSFSLGWEDLLEHIHKSIEGKKFLLVLDDVWTEDFRKWEQLRQSLNSAARGSTILVTTRNRRVAKMMGTSYTHPLEELSKEVCRSLFTQMAFLGKSKNDCAKLEDIGRKIADKCKGLPLAAKTLGSCMRFKETEQDWQNVLDSEIWELEEAEKGLFPPLLLSYYDLPSALKPCFSYCAIFPKDDTILPDKLIKLWMAQGYLSSGRSTEMEITGREYFENLVMRSFFQNFERDEDNGGIKSCKMHDIVHDFAQFLTKNECQIIEVHGVTIRRSHRKVHHTNLKLKAKGSFPAYIYDAQNLRTLFLPHSEIPNSPPADLFDRLKCLRTLDLSNNSFKELPRKVGNLMHLRYLNLSYNASMEELPETVYNLCNLQTLDLSFCPKIQVLPKGMEKLINLRHFENMGTLRFLPKAIGRLSSLRTLSSFIISADDVVEACKLGDLENLNNLQGHLEISGLANVADAGEAKKARLKSRKHLLGLKLDFSAEGEKTAIDDLIEALQPHPNLEFLEICFYGGTSLSPNWMTSLTKLRKMSLFCCWNCLHLPPLGELPSLVSLKIDGMYSVKKVGVEFLALGSAYNGGTTGKDDGRGASLVIAFPKLKKLSFHCMEEWEEWDVMIEGRRKEEEIKIMPCLRSLTIVDCSQLNALPHHLQIMPLEELEIKRCPILKQRCQEGIGGDWAKISHIPNINIAD